MEEENQIVEEDGKVVEEQKPKKGKKKKKKKSKDVNSVSIAVPVPVPRATFQFCPGSDSLGALKVILASRLVGIYLSPVVSVNLLKLNSPTFTHTFEDSVEGTKVVVLTNATCILRYLMVLFPSVFVGEGENGLLTESLQVREEREMRDNRER